MTLIEMLTHAVEELSRGIEEFLETVGMPEEAKKEFEDKVLLHCLKLTNTARLYVAQSRHDEDWDWPVV